MKETKFKQTLVQTKDERRKTKESTRYCEERSDVAIQSGFKMTEVGMIPSDWEVKKVSDVAFNFTGLTYTPFDVRDYGTLVLRSSNIQNEQLCFFDNVYVDMDIPERALVKDGDILVCVRNGSKALIGKSALVSLKGEKIAFGAFMTILRAKENVCNIFLLYSWQSNLLQNQVQESLGATINQITNSDFQRYYIALPPTIEEQQRIANALSDVDALIANLEKLIAKKKNIKQGAMQQLLTGKKRLPGFAGKWSDFVLGQSGFLLKNSINPQFSATKYFSEYSMPAYDEIQKPERVLGCSMHSNRTQISGEVLLFNKLNVRQKRVWYVRKCAENAVCSMEFLPYCSQKIDLQLLRQILLTDEVTFDFIGMSTGTSNSQKRIAPKNFLDYSLRLPQDIREQKAIAEILVDMDSEIQALNKKIIQYRKLKTGMMQQLLTGKIRLV